MENAILISILVVIALLAMLGVANRLRGKGRGCCGKSGSYKPKKKRLSKVIYEKVFSVDGMHCEHCKARVEGAVNDLDGVSCRVDLSRKEATVSYEIPIDDARIVKRIEQAGYAVCASR